MNNLTSAIKIAVENGYNKTVLKFGEINSNDNVGRMLVLDPLFWIALGRGCGWGVGQDSWVCGGCGFKTDTNCCEFGITGWVREKWLYHALRYFDLLLSQGDTESFWEELIKI